MILAWVGVSRSLSRRVNLCLCLNLFKRPEPNLISLEQQPGRQTQLSEFSTDDEIRYPAGFRLADVVSWGTTGMVVINKSSNTVIKMPFDHSNQECLLRIEREREVYDRFAQRGGHEGLLLYHGLFESGVCLEYAPGQNLRLRVRDSDVGSVQRLRWAIQVAETIKFVHDAGIIHGDLTYANIFLDANLHAKVADFAGSSIDSSPLLVVMTESHEFPGPLLSIRADLFALGGLLYEITTGKTPYQGLDNTEIRALYLEHRFPETASLGAIGASIENYWQGNYLGPAAIVEALQVQESGNRLNPFLHDAFAKTSILAIVAVGAAVLFSGWKLSS